MTSEKNGLVGVIGLAEDTSGNQELEAVTDAKGSHREEGSVTQIVIVTTDKGSKVALKASVLLYGLAAQWLGL
jgi:hypothetical protein